MGNTSYQAGYAIGAAFTKWLLSPNSNSDAAQKQQQLQKQQMMEVIRLRQQEAERQHQAEEANRLAEMYNRLASTLKLGGLPQLQLKASGVADGGLQLKLGDSSHANTIPGLPGSSTTFAQHLSDLSSTDGLRLKLGNGAQASGTLGLPGGDPSTIDFNKMTPQQLADIAESVGKLPPQPTQQMTMRDFQQTLDGKTDLHRLDSSSATPGAGNQNPNATPVTGNESGAAQPGGQVQAQQPPQVMRDFQQTLDGKSDLTRVGSSSATPNAGNQKSNATPAIGNASGAPEPSGPAPSTAVAPATGRNSQGLQATSPAAGASAPAATAPPGARVETSASGQSAQGGSPVAPPTAAGDARVDFDQRNPGQTPGGDAVPGIKFRKASGEAAQVQQPTGPSVPVGNAPPAQPKLQAEAIIPAGPASKSADPAAESVLGHLLTIDPQNAATWLKTYSQENQLRIIKPLATWSLTNDQQNTAFWMLIHMEQYKTKAGLVLPGNEERILEKDLLYFWTPTHPQQKLEIIQGLVNAYEQP